MCLRLRQVRTNAKINHHDTKMFQNRRVTAVCSRPPELDPLQLFGEASAPAVEWDPNAGQINLLGTRNACAVGELGYTIANLQARESLDRIQLGEHGFKMVTRS